MDFPLTVGMESGLLPEGRGATGISCRRVTAADTCMQPVAAYLGIT